MIQWQFSWTGLIFLVISGFFIWVGLIGYRATKAEAKKWQAELAANKSGSEHYLYAREEEAGVIGGTNLDRFLIECVLSECDDFSKEKNIERAKLLAQKYNLSIPNGVEQLYNSALEAHTPLARSAENERIAIKQREESAEYDQLIRYSNFYGKDKKIAMLTDRMKELREAADVLDKGLLAMVQSTYQEKEKDWAILGGLASGLAGTGAGIATALDIQAQNAQIRAQNEANRRAAMPAYMAITENSLQNKANARAIEKEIESTKNKLVSDMPDDQVMELLDITNTTVDVSETGAFVVTATIKPKRELLIYEDVEAVADGTIFANVYDGSVHIGTAMMVLPVDGVSHPVGIKGMELSGAKLGKKYTVTYTPCRLWLMEM